MEELNQNVAPSLYIFESNDFPELLKTIYYDQPPHKYKVTNCGIPAPYWIPDDKFSALERKKRKEDQALSVASLILLNSVFSRIFDIQVPFIPFHDAYGKPCAHNKGLNTTHLEISLSHTTNALALAISSMPLGCDVQCLTSYAHAYDSVLTPFEVNYFNTQNKISEQQRAELFTEIWTLKESWGKYLGVGLQAPLHIIDFLKLLLQTKQKERGIKSFSKASLCFGTGRQQNFAFAYCAGEPLSLKKVDLHLFKKSAIF